jgi:hypothetical protein
VSVSVEIPNNDSARPCSNLMDSRIGHDHPSNEALLFAILREHVQRACQFQGAARLQHGVNQGVNAIKFSHHDNQVVKSKRIPRKLGAT